MKVPVYVSYRTLEEEEVCYYDEYEKTVRCGDYNDEYEYTVDEIEFDQTDLEDIVDQYFNDIVEIIMHDNRYREKLLKKLSIQEKSSKH